MQREYLNYLIQVKFSKVLSKIIQTLKWKNNLHLCIFKYYFYWILNKNIGIYVLNQTMNFFVCARASSSSLADEGWQMKIQRQLLELEFDACQCQNAQDIEEKPKTKKRILVTTAPS